MMASVGQTRTVGLGQAIDLAVMNLDAVFAKSDRAASKFLSKGMLGHRQRAFEGRQSPVVRS
jgi:hypothetical protein